jgi:maltooligosyltrehalose trehalohydrolase
MRRRVSVVLEEGGRQRVHPLQQEEGGYFAGRVSDAPAGIRYRYRLDDDERLYPDPASRFQPEGPHGPSQIVDPGGFAWTDGTWEGVSLPGQVLYELHLGAFTREGTWKAAMEQLPELARLGVTTVEVMPVAEFSGRFGWGYDGVDLYAPYHLYGEPDDFRRFVDRAHALGLGVILDVVYNHFGPDGSYVRAFSPDYFSAKQGEWGDAINFDGPNAGPVRAFFADNAGYWIDEYHLDGLRLDATQAIEDASPVHILAEIGERVRAAAKGRSTIVVAENEPQRIRLIKPVEQGGYGLDALWNDDYHHSAMVALTGHNEAYYSDYHGSAQEFISAIKRGFLFQGQRNTHQNQPRGTPAFGVSPATFVHYLQNHDQVANSLRGERVHALTAPGRFRALTALTLLGPETPMLFMGEEFAASSPFPYFADHPPELARLVAQGRADFMSQFPSVATSEARSQLLRPEAPETFERSKLDWSERERHAAVYAMHRDLLRLRREEAVFRGQRVGGVDGAVLGPGAFVLRFFGDDGDDRLLVVNLATDLRLTELPEPLLAPPEGRHWDLRWSSEDVRYGGGGTPPIFVDDGWRIPGEAAVVLGPADGPTGRAGRRA